MSMIASSRDRKRSPWPVSRRSFGRAPLLIAERGGRIVFTRIGIMRALNAGAPDLRLVSRRKRANAYGIIR